MSIALCVLSVACSDPPVEPTQRVVGISSSASNSGQEQDLVAPGAALSVRVPIVPQPGRDFATYWCPEIRGADDGVVYKDSQGFPARFNVYWAWDDSQRLWLYNTDDGTVWVYAQGADAWTRSLWERGSALSPPASIAARTAGP